MLRPQETLALREWAEKKGLLFDEIPFSQKWESAGRIEGAEHQVYPEEGLFFKRNSLVYHANWLEYFNRLILHNWLFPDTTIQFIGLMDVAGELHSFVSQVSIRAERGAKREEVEHLMGKLGFRRFRNDDYVSHSLGILVEDLHDENVLVDADGDLLIFDPVIYLVKPEMRFPEIAR